MLECPRETIYKHPFYSMKSFPGVDGKKYLILTKIGSIREAIFMQKETAGTFLVVGYPTHISIKNVCGWALEGMALKTEDDL